MANGEKKLSTKREVDWFMVLIQMQAAFVIVIGLHVCVFQAQWRTIFFSIVLALFSNLGLTAGAHRLWAHQSYKATTKLKIFLALCHTLAGTGSIYNWARLHRLHHKHFGTDLDPYNCSKGFYFAHVTGFCFKLSEAQEEALNEIDTSDLENDQVVMFQHRFYWYLYLIIAVLLPVNAPAEYWGETLMNTVAIAGFMRLAVVFHSNLLISSGSKLLGLAPGEKFPSDTNLVFFFNKTHWISYHYLAPWDYQTGEYGKYGEDCPTIFINLCETLKLASDLKTVDSNTIRKALVKSVDEKKTFSDSLFELHNVEQKTKDNMFRPTKFF
ncbi:acyl-CoA Delta-12 desaturase [Harmonia axyridis]|uniref:acyl-CoA Delta-12 desaturase n=1 Tax=Harmonia axyridis TaxID=115357 RepID=UPI001E2771C3|nr:acyl-CoA Delta-12 desaturase [Harmonia axyridis]